MGSIDFLLLFIHLKTGLCCMVSKIRKAKEQFLKKRDQIECEMSILTYLTRIKSQEMVLRIDGETIESLDAT